MGLHVLQEIVIKLELDSTSSTGVRLCLGEISSEELHRVCREAAQVHSSVCTAVGRALPPGLGLGTSSCCTSWPGTGRALREAPAALMCVGISGICTKVSLGGCPLARVCWPRLLQPALSVSLLFLCL